ncbi:hypothetical protein MMC07_005004 [Pseudocyphellaria aurata]|nr:hypothetical protein [Pseudocyphellaria aurata]
MAILATQTALMAKILEDTKASLRQVFAEQIKEEIYAEYDKTAAAHREEIRAELIQKQLKHRNIMAPITMEDERMTKFSETLRPSISKSLISMEYANMVQLLTKAHLVEDKTRNINMNIPPPARSSPGGLNRSRSERRRSCTTRSARTGN